MNAITNFISENTGWLASSSEHRWQAIILLIGLSLLAVALLVLMLTRWGQVRPLSKCIGLSVFAHILLIVYAYGLHLFQDQPAGTVDQVIQVTLLAPDELLEDQPQVEEAPVEPPSMAELPDTLPAETQEDQDDAVDEESLVETVEEQNPSPPEPEATEPATADAAEDPSASEAEEPVADPPPEETPGRLTITGPAAPIDRSDEATAPDSPPAAPADIQHLADLPTSPDASEHVTDQVDQLPTVSPESMAAEPNGWHEVNSETSSSTAGSVAAAIVGATTVARTGTRSGDGAPLPTSYSARMSADKSTVVLQNGGSEQTENAVKAALDWFAMNQGPDGRWDCDLFGGGQETQVLGQNRDGAGAEADTGISGLVLLAFLGAGNTHLEGDYQDTVRRGLEFLMLSQAADGSLAGRAKLYARMYCHGMATLALSEAAALTGDYRITPYLQRAVAYSVAAQDRTGGGWRYQPGDPGDMSQMGWQLMALHSSQAAGVATPAQTRAGMIRFITQSTTGARHGLAGYRPHASPSRTMTAEAMVCRIFLGLNPDQAARREAVAYVMQETPQTGRFNLYYWYYATLMMFQIGDQQWPQWNEALTRRLLATQRQAGTAAGSWDPTTVWGSYGGRFYSTAMATLCLEVYYRYLPIYAGAVR